MFPHICIGDLNKFVRLCHSLSLSLCVCMCVFIFRLWHCGFSGKMINDGSSRPMVLPLPRFSWACIPNLESQVRQPPSLPYRKESFGWVSRGPEEWEAKMRSSQLRCQEVSGRRPPGNLGSTKIECSISWVWCWGKDVDSSQGQLAFSSWSPVPV